MRVIDGRAVTLDEASAAFAEPFHELTFTRAPARSAMARQEMDDA